jgi:galactan 5-O-arabinofuranosyltransferase
MTTTATSAAPPGTDPVVGEPDARAWCRIGGELLAAAVVAGLTSAVVQQVIDALVIPRPSYVPEALSSAATVVLVGAVLLLALRRRWPRWGTVAAWSLLSALSTTVLSLLLHGTRLYLNGLSGDQSFRTAYLARLTDSPVPSDMTYADTAPYYPSGWFWVAGRITDLAGLEAWAAYKPLAIATMAIAGALAFTAWSVVAGRRTALLLGLATVLVGLRTAAYEPYSWMLLVLIPPLAVITWRLLRSVADGRPAGRAGVVALGVFLGLTAMVYTLLTVFFGFLAVLAGVVAVVAGSPGRGKAARSVLGTLLLVALVAVPFAAVVWTPFFVAAVRDGLHGNAAQQYLPDVGAQLPLPMFEPTLAGVTCAAGLVWILVAARRNPLAAGLGLVVAAVYGWYLLSTVALALGTTLLAFRLEPALVLSLFCAAVLGVGEVVRRFTGRLPSATYRTVVTGLAVVVLLGSVGLVQAVPEANRDFVDTAFSDHTPLGVSADGGADLRQPGSWSDELARAIDEMTDRPADELVVLTTYYPLLAHGPYRGFQTSIAQYANPLADFDGRRAEILSWTEATSPADLAARWAASPYRLPSVLVLSRADDGLHLNLTADLFPREPNIAHIDAVFDPAVFTGPGVTTRDVGPFVVVVPAGPAG